MQTDQAGKSCAVPKASLGMHLLQCFCSEVPMCCRRLQGAMGSLELGEAAGRRRRRGLEEVRERMGPPAPRGWECALGMGVTSWEPVRNSQRLQ